MLVQEKQRRTTGPSCCLSPSACKPGVYALMAISRYRDALVLKPTLGRTLVYQPLVPKELTASFQVILVPPRAFDAQPPVARDVYFAVALFLQQRTLHPELIQDHRGPGSLLLTPRLDSQATFAKLIADIGVEGDIRYAQLTRLLENGAPCAHSCHLATCPNPTG